MERVIEFFRDDGKGYIFRISISSDPEILDPQIATDESSVAILKNMFVGLLKQEENGTIAAAGAKDYSISSDGLVYTFYLDESYTWKTIADWEGSVTAYDYEFAFRRLFDPLIESPYAEDYYCIQNASAANKGECELSEIGVVALDDYTLEITLAYPNAEFPSLLTRLPASPCNEEFFELCNGKYGLEADCIASNGAFYVRYWLHEQYGTDNYVRLRRNDGYSGISEVYPYGVNFLVQKDSAVRLSDFTGGTTDVYISSEFASELESYLYDCSYAYFCGLAINPDTDILSRSEVLEILSLAIDRQSLESKTPDILMTAYGLVPPVAYVGSSNYRRSVSTASDSLTALFESSSQLAEYKWSFTLADSEKLMLYGMKIMTPDSFPYNDYLSYVVEMINDTLGIGMGIDIVNGTDYASRLESGNYEICLAVIGSSGSSALEYLGVLSTGYGISSDKYKEAATKSGKYQSLTAEVYDIFEAELEIAETGLVIPLWYTPVFIFTSDEISGLYYDSFSGASIFEKVLKQ